MVQCEEGIQHIYCHCKYHDIDDDGFNILGFPGGASGEEPSCQCRGHKRHRFDLWLRKIPWKRAWRSTPVFLPAEFHRQRSLAGYGPWGRKELNTPEVTQHTQHACVTRKSNMPERINAETSAYHELFSGFNTEYLLSSFEISVLKQISEIPIRSYILKICFCVSCKSDCKCSCRSLVKVHPLKV